MRKQWAGRCGNERAEDARDVDGGTKQFSSSGKDLGQCGSVFDRSG
ncbi:hypothetical protein PC123_g28100 [Phytophthora cactorum]|nr:hypothetical protein PC123_g28100 [Phytophthora cactorum]